PVSPPTAPVCSHAPPHPRPPPSLPTRRSSDLVVLTSARGIRARSIAEHVLMVTIALARRLPHALRAQMAHHWAQEELEGPFSDEIGRAQSELQSLTNIVCPLLLYKKND